MAHGPLTFPPRVQPGPEGEAAGAGGSEELGANPKGKVVDLPGLRSLLGLLLDVMPRLETSLLQTARDGVVQ